MLSAAEGACAGIKEAQASSEKVKMAMRMLSSV
jgi:hypothetical protein